MSTVLQQLTSKFFRKRSRFEAYEEALANLIRKHRVNKIKLDEELQKDLRVRSSRLQKIQSKHSKELLALRIEHEKTMTTAIHEHRMRIAQREVDLQRKTTMLEENLQVDLRRVEQSMMNNEWKINFDPDSGQPYYVNEKTQESRWYRPMDGDGALLVGAHDPSMQEIREDVKCVICLDYFEGQVSQCPNGHLFCEGCLNDCLNVKPSCPVCRCEMHPGHATRNILAERMAKKAKRQEEAMERAAEGEIPTTVAQAFRKHTAALKEAGASHLKSIAYAKTGLKNIIENLDKVNAAEELKLFNTASAARKKIQKWLDLLLDSFGKKSDALDEEFKGNKTNLDIEYGINEQKQKHVNNSKILDRINDKASHDATIAAAMGEEVGGDSTIEDAKKKDSLWLPCVARHWNNKNTKQRFGIVVFVLMSCLFLVAVVFGGLLSAQQNELTSLEDRLNAFDRLENQRGYVV